MESKPRLLFVTDFQYQALGGREYYKEDIFLIGQLENDFDIVACNPRQTEQFEGLVDGLLMRNIGATIYFQDAFAQFTARVKANEINCYNSLDGLGDQVGKNHLVDLTKKGFPAVIPTISDPNDWHLIENDRGYISKPIRGSDSLGIEQLTKRPKNFSGESVFQAYLDIEHEVSFYFVDSDFQYALYAPDKTERWKLVNYSFDNEELELAKKLVEWNSLSCGIQRVDFCRTTDGRFLLMEIEDLNPYLSLLEVDDANRNRFVTALKKSLLKNLA